MADEKLIPLKLKYLVHKGGGSYKSKSSNSGTRGDKGQILRPRRKAYGPF